MKEEGQPVKKERDIFEIAWLRMSGSVGVSRVGLKKSDLLCVCVCVYGDKGWVYG